MRKKYIIGIDGGSQSSKVTIFDTEGNVVCEGKQRLKPLHLYGNGFVEHPDDDLWDSIVTACRQAMDLFPGDKDDILGLGLCTIRFCRVLLKSDGTLAQPVMSWMDSRVSRPYEHLNPSVRYVTTTTGYITNRFTGRFVDTAANYQGQWPIDTDTWQWSKDSEVIERYHLPREMLFDLQMPGTILGHVTEHAAELTGIPLGLPVIATANDKAVEALGAGLHSNKTVLISLGTYIAAMINGSVNLRDQAGFWTNFASIPNDYLYESNGIRRGMWTISWFVGLFGDALISQAGSRGIAPEEYLEQEAEHVPPGSEGLMTVLDWLAPSDQPFKRGLMVGFNGHHTRAHIYRSILEATALTMKNHVDAMCAELDGEVEKIIISGGGAKSDLFVQIFADVFGIPATRNWISDAAGLGSAICTAVALGVYDNYQSAIDNMVKPKDTKQPTPENTVLYHRINEEVYKHITHFSDEILKRSYPIFG